MTFWGSFGAGEVYLHLLLFMAVGALSRVRYQAFLVITIGGMGRSDGQQLLRIFCCATSDPTPVP